MMFSAIRSVWNGVNRGTRGGTSAILSTPKASTCGGRPTVKLTSEMPGVTSSIDVRMASSSARFILVLPVVHALYEGAELFLIESLLVGFLGCDFRLFQ